MQLRNLSPYNPEPVLTGVEWVERLPPGTVFILRGASGVYFRVIRTASSWARPTQIIAVDLSTGAQYTTKEFSFPASNYLALPNAFVDAGQEKP